MSHAQLAIRVNKGAAGSRPALTMPPAGLGGPSLDELAANMRRFQRFMWRVANPEAAARLDRGLAYWKGAPS